MVQTPIFGHFEPVCPFGPFLTLVGRLGVSGESKLVDLDGPFEAIFGDFRALLGPFGYTWLEALGMGARFAHRPGMKP